MTRASPLAERISTLLAVDPRGLGGVWVRARHGPAREVLVAALAGLPGLHGRIAPEAGDEALFGGIDLSQSLISGRLVQNEGIFLRCDVLWLTRSEQMPVGLAARLATALDRGDGKAVVLSDESSEADQVPPTAMLDRLAFFLSDQGEFEARLPVPHLAPAEIKAARSRLGSVGIPDTLLDLSVRMIAELGCAGSRPALFVLNAARAIAAVEDADEVLDVHLAEAARLVLAHRIQARPEGPTEESQPEVDQKPESGDSDTPEVPLDSLADIVLDAARTTLPDGLLEALAKRDKRGSGSGQGAHRTSYLRGRPLPSRPGSPDGRAKLDLLATLQAAAPWQKLRGASDGHLEIRKSDLRIRRYRERSERMLVFLVDASGSAAMARLAEAKGAAEMLLAEAYRSRDHVCLISFRGDGAECVLEPTRSLVRAKRMLGGLAGGGATPLAAGLRLGAEQAAQARKKGLTPHIVLMTDGRANRALNGNTNREEARADALRMARYLAAHAVPALIVDSGLRPSPELAEISAILDAQTIRLPKGRIADAAQGLMAALDT